MNIIELEMNDELVRDQDPPDPVLLAQDSVLSAQNPHQSTVHLRKSRKIQFKYAWNT